MNRRRIFHNKLKAYSTKKYLLRLMAVMACLALVMAAVSTVILTVLRNDRMNREREMQEIILDSMVEEFGRKINQSYQAIYSILGNRELVDTLSAYRRVINSYADDQKIQNVISSMYFVYQSNPDILNVMIYQKDNDYVVSFNGVTSADSYYAYSFAGEDAIWQTMKQPRVNMRIFVSEGRRSLYILHSVYNGNRDFGTLALELDISNDFAAARIAGNVSERIICLTDASGAIAGYLSNAHDDGMVTAAMAEGQVPGYLMLKRDVSSEKLTLIALTPTRAITSEVSMLFGVCALIVAATLIAGLAVSVKVCNQIMAPLYQAVELIDAAGKAGGHNELETITRNFNSIIKDRDEMTAIVARTTPTVLETIFRRLITGVSDEHDFAEMLDALSIEMRTGAYSAVVIRSNPGIVGLDLEKDFHLFERSIRDTFGGAIFLGFHYRKAEYVLIVNAESTDGSSAFCGSAQAFARETSLIIGIGRACQNILQIGESYRSASEAIAARAANQRDGGVYDAGAGINRVGYELSPDMESLIYKYIIAGNAKLANSTITRALSANLDRGVSHCDYIEMLTCVESYLERMYDHMDISTRQRVTLEVVPEEDADSIPLRTEILLRNCETLCGIYDTDPDDETLNRIMAYINDNLHHDISLNDVAEHVGLSANYLTRYFKMKSGVNFKAFLTDRRIEKAKAMLESTDMTVQDIAEKCGYNSSKQLILNFSKITGVTPGEYKKTLAMKGGETTK